MENLKEGGIDVETLEILKNPMVLTWAKKFGCENIKANGELKKQGETFGFVSKENSVGFIDESFVKMLVTNVKINGDAHTRIGLKQLQDVMRTMSNDIIESSTLHIREESGKPCFIEIKDDKSGITDVVIVAPRSQTDKVEQKAKEKAQKEKVKPTKPTKDDDEEDIDSDDEEVDETDE